MKHKTSPQTLKKQRLASRRSLFSRVKNKKWRAKSYSFKLGTNLHLRIHVRRFTTQADNRSALQTQYVLRLGLFGIKEVALYVKRKKSKNSRQLIARQVANGFIVFGMVGVSFFGLRIIGVGHTNPPLVSAESVTSIISEPEKETLDEYLKRSVPLSLHIPAIDVSAEIKSVGLLADGSLETPELLSHLVGWYKFGPTPGELGPAVLVGHVDTYKGPSVFWHLSRLQPNDTIIINRADQETVTFVVNRIAAYDQDRFLTNEVYGDIDYAGLRIITCGGTFNYFTGRYSHNTVVFASRVQ